MQQHNDEENLGKVLNGVDLSQVPAGTSLNATARALMRATFGETACFNDLRKGEFDILLGLVAQTHRGQNVSSVFTNAYSIKNSQQQMKHDANKKGPLTMLKKTILKRKQASTVHERLAQNDEHEAESQE